MNNENLINPNNRTSSERREIAQKGGKKSGEVRRKRKNVKDTLKYLLALPSVCLEGDEKLNTFGIEESMRNNGTAMCCSIMLKALRGDLEAARYITEMIGEKPASSLNLSGKIEEEITVPKIPKALTEMSVEELRELKDGLQNASGENKEE